jgi:predicted O-methyltransferase YrrM
MNKINKAITALLRIARRPWLLNLVLDEDSTWQVRLKKKYRQEFGLKTVPLPSLLNEKGCHLPVFSFLDGGSMPTDLALLRSLAVSIPNCSFFEIGTWRGESAVNLADVVLECHTLNLSPNEMRALNWPEKYIDLQGFYTKNIGNVVQHFGDSAQFDFQGLNKKFDLIFIDGDHHYAAVKTDTARVFEHLVHDKTVVVWHDAAFTPEKLRFEVIAGILDGSPAALHNHIYHVSNSQCAIYYPGGLNNASRLQTPEEPQWHFDVKLGLKKS